MPQGSLSTFEIMFQGDGPGSSCRPKGKLCKPSNRTTIVVLNSDLKKGQGVEENV